MKLKNISNQSVIVEGMELPPEAEMEIPSGKTAQHLRSEQVQDWLVAGVISLNDGSADISADNVLNVINAVVAPRKASSWAVDRDGADQELEGTEWTRVVPTRVLWDYLGEYDANLGEVLARIASSPVLLSPS